MKHLSQQVRVAIEEDNPSLERIEEKCIKCGQCMRICNSFIGVNNNYDLEKSKKAICVNCGQCIKVCPADSLIGKDEYAKVKELIGQKIVIVSTSPSVRVALGDEFGFEKGSFVEGKMVALLKKLGFSYVLDTTFAADLTIMEEASELLERIKNEKNLPMFTSCCPAWIKYAEIFYPEILPNISTCKSPIAMQGAIIKTYFAQKMNISAEDIINVCLTPCVAKKFEIRRKEFCASAEFNKKPMRDMDFCMTTQEIVKWAREENIDFKNLPDEKFDDFYGSGGGVIFGNSGGVMESAVRSAYSFLTGNRPSDLLLNFEAVRGFDNVKTAEVDLAGKKVKIAVVFGLANAKRLLEKIRQGEKYDFVEIMTCPGGCIGGAGQPKHLSDEVEYEKARINSLYERDRMLKCRSAHENPEITDIYDKFLGEHQSELAKRLLHTYYVDKSKILKGEYNEI